MAVAKPVGAESWTADPTALWGGPTEAALDHLGSSATGLTSDEAGRRRARLGPNTLQRGGRTDTLSLLVRQFESPIILILAFATVISGVLGDATDAIIILAIIVLSGLLGFWQERGATRAVEALLAVVRVTVEARRDGRTVAIPVEDVVPGDVVLLNAGDVVPGDCLVLESRTLLVDEAALTGETYPVEKVVGAIPAADPIAHRTNALFMGTHVVSGSGLGAGRADRSGHGLRPRVRSAGGTPGDHRLRTRDDRVRLSPRASDGRPRRRHLRRQRRCSPDRSSTLRCSRWPWPSA